MNNANQHHFIAFFNQQQRVFLVLRLHYSRKIVIQRLKKQMTQRFRHQIKKIK